MESNGLTKEAARDQQIGARSLKDDLLRCLLGFCRYVIVFAVLFSVFWVYFYLLLSSGGQKTPNFNTVFQLATANAAILFFFVLFPLLLAENIRRSFLSYWIAAAVGLSIIKLLVVGMNSKSGMTIYNYGVHFYIDGSITLLGVASVLFEIVIFSTTIAACLWATERWISTP